MQQSLLFSENLNDIDKDFLKGGFSIITETSMPLKDQDFSLSLTSIKSTLDEAKQTENFSTTLLLDRAKGEDSYSNSESILEAVSDFIKKSPVTTISGKGMSEQKIIETIYSSLGRGCNNFLAVTGDRSSEHTNSKKFDKSYVDSCNIVDIIKQVSKESVVSVTTNPFKYTAKELLPQYRKLRKKIEAGADAVFSQAGWDIFKYYELATFMRINDYNIPLIARLMLPTTETISAINSGTIAGVVMSKPFGSHLEREARNGDTESLASNMHRVALLAAGCRLLGYNAVSIAGLTSASLVKMVLQKVNDLCALYNDWDSWLEAWQGYDSGITLQPNGYNFYLFNNLKDVQPNSPREDYSFSEVESKKISVYQKFRYYTSKLFQLDKGNGPIRSFLGMAFYKSTSSAKQLYYLPADQCPKRLIKGPCGGSIPGGDCEFKHNQCVFSSAFKYEYFLNKLDIL